MAQPAMMKINFHRIIDKPEEVREEDVNKFVQEQPIIFSERGAEIGKKYGESRIGEAIGLSLGKRASVEVKIVLGIHQFVSQIANFLKELVEQDEHKNYDIVSIRHLIITCSAIQLLSSFMCSSCSTSSFRKFTICDAS